MGTSPLTLFIREYAARDSADVDGACLAAGIDADEALDYLETDQGRRALCRAQRRRGLSVALGDHQLLHVVTDPGTPGRERLEAVRLVYQRFGEDGASRQAEAMERNRLSGLTPQEYWLYVRDQQIPGLIVDAKVLEMAEGRLPQLAAGIAIPLPSNDQEAGEQQMRAARGLLAVPSARAGESPDPHLPPGATSSDDPPTS